MSLKSGSRRQSSEPAIAGIYRRKTLPHVMNAESDDGLPFSPDARGDAKRLGWVFPLGAALHVTSCRIPPIG